MALIYHCRHHVEVLQKWQLKSNNPSEYLVSLEAWKNSLLSLFVPVGLNKGTTTRLQCQGLKIIAVLH